MKARVENFNSLTGRLLPQIILHRNFMKHFFKRHRLGPQTHSLHPHHHRTFPPANTPSYAATSNPAPDIHENSNSLCRKPNTGETRAAASPVGHTQCARKALVLPPIFPYRTQTTLSETNSPAAPPAPPRCNHNHSAKDMPPPRCCCCCFSDISARATSAARSRSSAKAPRRVGHTRARARWPARVAASPP